MTKTIVFSIIFALSVFLAYFYLSADGNEFFSESLNAPSNNSTTVTSTVSQDEADKLTQSEAEKKLEYREISISKTTSENWWKSAVVYQIWPRSFKDSNGDGNGDLAGITQKLDYLKTLGVDAIWLNPIFESDSYHGYDTTDFYAVESDYGSMEDFKNLVDSAHDKGIKVILDFALNHVSMDHEWFRKSANKEEGFEDYFIWKETLPEGYSYAWTEGGDSRNVWHTITHETKWRGQFTRKDFFYGVFGFAQPDLNLENPKVKSEIINIARYWLDKGVDGFRLDAVRYMVEEGPYPLQADSTKNMEFWRSFISEVKLSHPNVYLIGEAFADIPIASKYYLNGEGFDQVFDFGFNLLATESFKPVDTDAESSDELLKTMTQSTRNAIWDNLKRKSELDDNQHFFANSISNHDLDRSSLTFDGNLAAAKLASTLLLALPNTPYLYYGEEIGLKQHKPGADIYRRGPMHWNSSKGLGFTEGTPWTNTKEWKDWFPQESYWWSNFINGEKQPTTVNVAAQEQDSNSLLNHYKSMIGIRKSIPQLSNPEKIRLYNYTGNVWVSEHISDGESVWFIFNLLTNSSATTEPPASLLGDYVDELSGEQISFDDVIALQPGQALILKHL